MEVMAKVKQKPGNLRSSPLRATGQSMRWWCRYRLLLLAVIVCVVQIFVGLSFFNSYSSHHEHGGIFSPDELPSDVARQQQARHTAPSINYSCHINDREALSAISRAATPGCKQDIADFACALQNDNVYPRSLPSYCKHEVNERSRGLLLGCYQDSFRFSSTILLIPFNALLFPSMFLHLLFLKNYFLRHCFAH